MIRALQTKNVGPIKNLDIEFGSRFSVITGDNGLGKSFILDLIWWSLTRTWVHDVNHKLMHGFMARPKKKLKGEISFTICKDKHNIKENTNNCDTSNGSYIKGRDFFDYESQAWQTDEPCPTGSGIVLYAMPDGSFALWDSARNYIDTKKPETASRQPAYIFSSEELWNGLETKDGKILCNGIIRDWASWQKENGLAFKKLQTALKHLSAEEEELTIGDLTRIDINDARDIPTIRMPYGEDVPIIYASSAIKRIISLAYLLVWTIIEHGKTSDLLNKKPSSYITFLVDELDVHLHPRWQRTILPALLETIKRAGSLEDKDLAIDPLVQVITITHSPLTLLSLEGLFDEDEYSSQDIWIDIDFDPTSKEVLAKQRPFLKQGNVADWLTSNAFDLKTDFSLKKENLYLRIKNFLESSNPTKNEAQKLATELDGVLSELDPMWLDFLDVCETQGWKI